MTSVVNLRRESYDVYIGRPGRGQRGQFGNPVAVGHPCPFCSEVHMSAGETLPCFKTYFMLRIETDLEFRQEALQLKDQRLGCFCKPGPCHGDVIAEWLDRQTH